MTWERLKRLHGEIFFKPVTGYRNISSRLTIKKCVVKGESDLALFEIKSLEYVGELTLDF